MNEFETLPCGDKFCLDCIKYMFKEWYTSKKALSSFLCLTGNEKCNKVILEDKNGHMNRLILKALTSEEFSDLSMRSF